MDTSYFMKTVAPKEERVVLKTRMRNTDRRKKEYLKLVVKDFLFSRRQYPDYLKQMQEVSRSTQFSTKQGKKLKTFALSIR